MQRVWIAIAVIGVLAAVFYSLSEKSQDVTPLPGEVVGEAGTIPYTVLKTEDSKPYKKSLTIRVDLVDGRLPSVGELRAISMQYASSEHEQVSIAFYLPGMTIGEGAFATAHHHPTLEVKILEANVPEQYRELL